MVEIFFKDLSKEAQKAVLKEFNISSEEDGNWDVLPLFTLEADEEDDWEEKDDDYYKDYDDEDIDDEE